MAEFWILAGSVGVAASRFPLKLLQLRTNKRRPDTQKNSIGIVCLPFACPQLKWVGESSLTTPSIVNLLTTNRRYWMPGNRRMHCTSIFYLGCKNAWTETKIQFFWIDRQWHIPHFHLKLLISITPHRTTPTSYSLPLTLNNIIMNGLFDALNVSTADSLPERRKLEETMMLSKLRAG